jgi:hypothetical protein
MVQLTLHLGLVERNKIISYAEIETTIVFSVQSCGLKQCLSFIHFHDVVSRTKTHHKADMDGMNISYTKTESGNLECYYYQALSVSQQLTISRTVFALNLFKLHLVNNVACALDEGTVV